MSIFQQNFLIDIISDFEFWSTLPSNVFQQIMLKITSQWFISNSFGVAFF